MLCCLLAVFSCAPPCFFFRGSASPGCQAGRAVRRDGRATAPRRFRRRRRAPHPHRTVAGWVLRLLQARIVPPHLVVGVVLPTPGLGSSHDPYEAQRHWVRRCRRRRPSQLVLVRLQGVGHRVHPILGIEPNLRNPRPAVLGRNAIYGGRRRQHPRARLLEYPHLGLGGAGREAWRAACVWHIHVGIVNPHPGARPTPLQHPRNALPWVRGLLLRRFCPVLHDTAIGPSHSRLRHLPRRLLL